MIHYKRRWLVFFPVQPVSLSFSLALFSSPQPIFSFLPGTPNAVRNAEGGGGNSGRATRLELEG